MRRSGTRASSCCRNPAERTSGVCYRSRIFSWDEFLPGAVTQQKPKPEPAPRCAVRTSRSPPSQPPLPVLGEFVADIEASLGEDFLKAAPVPEPDPRLPQQLAKPVPPAPCSGPQSLRRKLHHWPPAQQHRRRHRITPRLPCPSQPPASAPAAALRTLQSRRRVVCTGAAPCRTRPYHRSGCSARSSSGRQSFSFRRRRRYRSRGDVRRTQTRSRSRCRFRRRRSRNALQPRHRFPRNGTARRSYRRIAEGLPGRSIAAIRSRRSCRPTPGWRNASLTKAFPRLQSAGMTKL